MNPKEDEDAANFGEIAPSSSSGKTNAFLNINIVKEKDGKKKVKLPHLVNS